jgi:hypothetical protein
MKKFCVSAGLLAAGAASIQSVSAQGLDVISPKAWSVSGTLRGFYDDNYNIAPGKKGSYGAEVSPSVSYNLPLQQTDMGIRYTYGLYYYQDRQDLGVNPFDQTHQVDMWLDHAINERWHINFTDTFASGQEPELLTPGPAVSAVPFRVNGNNIANHANIKLDTQWTPLFGTSLHYENDFYDYQNSGSLTFTQTTNAPAGPLPVIPSNVGKPFFGIPNNSASLAGLLNRVEQNIGLDLNWTLSSKTKLFVGYTFGIANYTGGETIAIFNYLSQPSQPDGDKHIAYQSDSRDLMTQNVYVGANHQITENLGIQAQIGAQYNDNYNDPLNTSSSTSFAPVANVSLNYTYTTGSYLQLGVSQSENSTDVVAPNTSNGSITEYQYSTVLFADVNQRITEKLMGSLLGRYAYSTYQGGQFDSSANNEFNVGVNLSYQITRHFSAEVGYNYDDLQSEVPGQGYSRNRVYIGMGASY